jgi:phospholipase C
MRRVAPEAERRFRRPPAGSGPIGLFLTALAGYLGACGSSTAPEPTPGSGGVPHLEHLIVVVMENRSYDTVRQLPYTSALIADGSSFSESYGVTHPSQPNYLALWSGGLQGVHNDNCPAPGSPFDAENLGHACEAAGLSWRAYSEDLPSAGSATCSAAGSNYARKHAPWTNFANLDHGNERPYSDLAADLADGSLPDLAFVVPNQCNDQHSCSVSVGDDWLSQNVPAMLDGVGPRGVVIVTYDEDDGYSGNHILTCIAGDPVRPGYVSSTRIDHYTLLRTLCEALGLAPFGAAAQASPVTDVWRGAAAQASPVTHGWRGAAAISPLAGASR